MRGYVHKLVDIVKIMDILGGIATPRNDESPPAEIESRRGGLSLRRGGGSPRSRGWWI